MLSFCEIVTRLFFCPEGGTFTVPLPGLNDLSAGKYPAMYFVPSSAYFTPC